MQLGIRLMVAKFFFIRKTKIIVIITFLWALMAKWTSGLVQSPSEIVAFLLVVIYLVVCVCVCDLKPFCYLLTFIYSG